MANGELTITLDEALYADLQKKLSKLTVLEQQATVQTALREGLRVINVEGKRNLIATMSSKADRISSRQHMAAKRGGSLEKSFGTRVFKKAIKGHAGFGKYGRHAHLVDTGTVDRWTKKGAYRGRVTGSRFWRTAFEAKKNEAINELRDSIIKSIEKITR